MMLDTIILKSVSNNLANIYLFEVIDSNSRKKVWNMFKVHK